jgi:hypothetical protein
VRLAQAMVAVNMSKASPIREWSQGFQYGGRADRLSPEG